MVNIVYDGSWNGFLSAVFEVYERKLLAVNIIPEKLYQPDAFADNIAVDADLPKALRVWTGLKKKLSGQASSSIYACFLSELPGIEFTLLQFIQLAFSVADADKAYANPAVLKVSQTAKMVHREKHRMEAFVRFKLTKDDIYYAGIEPDFNVLPLILQHFKKRYADQKWLIYDLKRKYGIYYNLDNVEEVSLELEANPEHQSSEFLFKEEEALYQSLWKDYFTHVNITERKNTKLHLRHVPKRYWKYLTEK